MNIMGSEQEQSEIDGMERSRFVHPNRCHPSTGGARAFHPIDLH